MERVPYYVGVDIASKDFVASICDEPGHELGILEDVENRPAGFQAFIKWLTRNKVTAENSIICLENTGVYSEGFCYYLTVAKYRVTVVSPLHAKKRFTTLSKTDRIDAKQLAEYAYRYRDQLTQWQPRDPVLEQVKTLYATREHLTRQLIANKNALTALERKVVQTKLATVSHRNMVVAIGQQIKAIDAEIKNLIDSDSTYRHLSDLADSVPGVGAALANSLLIMTDGFSTTLEHKRLCSRLGIAPHQKESGTSVQYTPQSLRHGNTRIRKLLHLAARSVATHVAEFKQYFLRKLAQGKPKLLIYNNIANKLIKIIFAVIRSQKPYCKGYLSLNPMYLATV